MKNYSPKKLITSLLVLTTLCSSLTLFAAPSQMRIKAVLDSGYKYMFNNKSILDKDGTIVYKDRIYVPLDSLANSLGFDVSIRDKNVAITPAQPTKPTPPPKPQPTPQNVTIPKAEILGIDFSANTVTILPAGKKNDLSNQIVLNVTPETTITDGKTKKAYSITDLTTGIPVQVVHSSAMTKSIPPQTNAITITLL